MGDQVRALSVASSWISKGSAPLTECSVILSEASLRAKSKDPHLVASSAWVADPSQAQCHPERSEPASEVEGSAPRRVERLGRGSFASSHALRAPPGNENAPEAPAA